MAVRVLIADDEPPARRKLRAHMASDLRVEVAGEAEDGLKAAEAVRLLAPDLVFLDIQMPGLGGFEVIEAVGADEMPPVVFVTAYDQFAIRAFEVEAVDYLLKPFDEERFRRALDRALARIEAKVSERERMARLLEAVAPRPAHLQRLVARKGDRLLLIPVGEIVRISARENYAEVFTASGSHLVRETMNRLEERLDPARFARVHRGEIVALDRVRELQPWAHGDYLVVLENGEKVRLSRRYRDRLLP